MEYDLNSELQKGIEVEEEHRKTLEKLASGEISVDEAVAETAKTHIAEDENYYTNLENIEKNTLNYKNLESMIPESKRFIKGVTVITELHNNRKYHIVDYDDECVTIQLLPKFSDEGEQPIFVRKWEYIYQQFCEREISISGYSDGEEDKLYLVIQYYKGDKLLEKTRRDSEEIKHKLEERDRLAAEEAERKRLEEEEKAEQERLAAEEAERIRKEEEEKKILEQQRKESLSLRKEILEEMVKSSKGKVKQELKIKLDLVEEMLNDK